LTRGTPAPATKKQAKQGKQPRNSTTKKREERSESKTAPKLHGIADTIIRNTLAVGPAPRVITSNN
jgi:hypothetical protein